MNNKPLYVTAEYFNCRKDLNWKFNSISIHDSCSFFDNYGECWFSKVTCIFAHSLGESKPNTQP